MPAGLQQLAGWRLNAHRPSRRRRRTNALDRDIDADAVLPRDRRPAAVDERQHFTAPLPNRVTGLAVPAQERPRRGGHGRLEAGGAPFRSVDVQGRCCATAAVVDPAHERVAEVRYGREVDLRRRQQRRLTLRAGAAAIDACSGNPAVHRRRQRKVIGRICTVERNDVADRRVVPDRAEERRERRLRSAVRSRRRIAGSFRPSRRRSRAR